MEQPDILTQFIIPLVADLLLFILKAGTVAFLAGYLIKKYISPCLLKKQETVANPVSDSSTPSGN